jgi:hypothetical protein
MKFQLLTSLALATVVAANGKFSHTHTTDHGQADIYICQDSLLKG